MLTERVREFPTLCWRLTGRKQLTFRDTPRPKSRKNRRRLTEIAENPRINAKRPMRVHRPLAFTGEQQCSIVVHESSPGRT